MNNEEIKDVVTKAAIENVEGNHQFIVRTGEAAKVYNKEPLNISGTIDAPSRFLEQRNGLYEKDRSHCLVSKSRGVIDLVINEDDPETKKSIQGKISLSELYVKLGINDSKKSYSPNELANCFKLLRSIFESKSDHMRIVKSLQNLKAKVKQDLDSKDDKRGNVSATFSQTVEANIPDSFNLILPIIEGESVVKIEVFITLEASSAHDIICYLESMDAAELVDKNREELVMKEVEKLEGKTTIMYV